MARATAIIVLALALVVVPAAFAVDTSLATLGLPIGLNVRLEYVISGELTDPKPCNSSEAGCVPVLATAENKNDADTVIVHYSLNDVKNVTSKNNTGIALRACFTPASITDRPWRKDKKVVNPSESNQCKAKMNSEPLPFRDGKFAYKLPNTTPAATYMVRAYTICGEEDGKTIFCAWGQSPGHYETTMWDTTPTWLVAVTAPLICVGPLLLLAYGGGHYIKKAKKST